MRSIRIYTFALLAIVVMTFASLSCDSGIFIPMDNETESSSGSGNLDNPAVTSNDDDLNLPEGSSPVPFAEETEPFEGLPASEFPEITREGSDLTRLNPPTGVVASDGTYNDRTRVKWNNPDGEQPAVYYIYRRLDTGAPIGEDYIGARSYPGTVFDDIGATPGTKYYYSVKSHKTGFTDSYASNRDQGWRGDRMKAPVNVTASDGTYNDKVYVYWTHPSGVVPTSYYVYRSETPDNQNPIYIGGRSYPGRTFNDLTAVPGTKYYYKIKSHKDGFKDSYFSNEHRGYRSNRMESPENLQATDGLFSEKVLVTWNHPSGVTPESYYIYRSETDSNPNPDYIGICGYPDKAYNDTTATPGSTYYYTVKSHKTGYNDSPIVIYDDGWIGIWDTTVIEDYYVPAEFSNIDVDADGHPFIAFVDTANDQAWYAEWNGSTWGSGWLESGNVVYNGPVAIQADSSGRPHGCYVNESTGVLRYKFYNGTSWEAFDADDSGYVLGAVSMKLDGYGKAHIAYIDATNGYLMYATNASGSFVNTAVDDSGDVGTSFVSLALDSSGKPCIVYRNVTDSTLLYAYYDGSTWQGDTIEGTSSIGSDYFSLALDSNNLPCVVYRNNDTKALIYAHYDGTDWNKETVGTMDSFQASLALDSNDNPHISYYDQGLGELWYSYWDGNQWNDESVDSSSSDIGGETSMIIDAYDHPHISYYDFETGYLMYATLN